MTDAFQTVINEGGIESEADYPYTSGIYLYYYIIIILYLYIILYILLYYILYFTLYYILLIFILLYYYIIIENIYAVYHCNLII
jgi:hypothetical protein